MGMGSCAVSTDMSFSSGIIQPERDIDAFDFLNVVFVCKCIWQVWHLTVKFLQFCHGVLFFELEWDDIVRSVTVGKL